MRLTYSVIILLIALLVADLGCAPQPAPVAPTSPIVQQATANITITTIPTPPKAVFKEVELKYDDGEAKGCISAIPPTSTGYVVGFRPPSVPITIKKVSIYGTIYGTGWEEKEFEVQIWDKAKKPLFRIKNPVNKFPITKTSDGGSSPPNAAWVEITIPDVTLDDSFYVHVYTGTGMAQGIHVGADDSVPNTHSDVTERRSDFDMVLNQWPYWPGYWFSSKSNVNWMIRVYGLAP